MLFSLSEDFYPDEKRLLKVNIKKKKKKNRTKENIPCPRIFFVDSERDFAD